MAVVLKCVSLILTTVDDPERFYHLTILLVMFTGLQVAVLLVLDATTCQHPVHVEAALVLHAMQHDMM